jgi:hypothetical protein
VYGRSDSDLAALAVYSGTPEILYYHNFSAGAATESQATATMELWHARISDEKIDFTPITFDNFDGAALALNSQGEPLIVYYVPNSNQLVAVKRVEMAFENGLYLPFAGRAWIDSVAR